MRHKNLVCGATVCNGFSPAAGLVEEHEGARWKALTEANKIYGPIDRRPTNRLQNVLICYVVQRCSPSLGDHGLAPSLVLAATSPCLDSSASQFACPALVRSGLLCRLGCFLARQGKAGCCRLSPGTRPLVWSLQVRRASRGLLLWDVKCTHMRLRCNNGT